MHVCVSLSRSKRLRGEKAVYELQAWKKWLFSTGVANMFNEKAREEALLGGSWRITVKNMPAARCSREAVIESVAATAWKA